MESVNTEISAELQAKINKLNKNSEFIKIRIIATLLRDYGVKEIVLSPGGRDVPIVRMFEYNDEWFHLHYVTDERSAAYFALGLAAQSRKPVACVCTSGTAVSNYLPAVTESYFTHIPLIMITADRCEMYHGHGEDQTIPQRNIFAGVIKKEITIPERKDSTAEYQTRRDVSDCILEATHGVPGPVHINMAIDRIELGKTVPKEYWGLLPEIYPHITRVSANDEEEILRKWVEELKKAKNILLVYGQNPPQSEKQLEMITRFVSRYNCTVVTDTISNLDCDYSLAPYIMLKAMDQEMFERELIPDIVISVGGKRLMNDPLTEMLRGSESNIQHWSVTPDGVMRDFYFKLTSVIEMTQDCFFRVFSDLAEGCTNDGVYYNKWKELSKQFTATKITKFTSTYVQSKFLPMIPPKSVLHLGVGLSFHVCRRFDIDKTTDVFCNMGTNGIDGCTSTFMGQCAIEKEKLCFLLVGDLSFFYDMNSLWNKKLSGNMRILMVNNNGTGLLRTHNLKAIRSVHNTQAQGWVESTGFQYLRASSPEELEERLKYFVDPEVHEPLFLEVLCE